MEALSGRLQHFKRSERTSTMKKVFLVTLFSSALMVAASVSPREASATTERGVAVECFNDANCASLLLSSICGSSRPVSISCSQVKFQTGAATCSPPNGAACKDLFSMASPINLGGTHTVGEFCTDTSGFDAIVFCSSP
jgi:hypothetical protein